MLGSVAGVAMIGGREVMSRATMNDLFVAAVDADDVMHVVESPHDVALRDDEATDRDDSPHSDPRLT